MLHRCSGQAQHGGLTVGGCAGDWHPSLYRGAPSMTAVSLDWEDKGPGGDSAEQAGAFLDGGSGLAATVMQERQASYMYIMPQEHLSSKDSPEVRIVSPRVDLLHVPRLVGRVLRAMMGCACQSANWRTRARQAGSATPGEGYQAGCTACTSSGHWHTPLPYCCTGRTSCI